MKKSILLTLGAIIIASVSLRGEDNNRGAWAVSIGPERLTETVEPEEFHYKDEERSFGQKVYDSSPLGHWDYLAPSDKIITAALPAVAALGGYQLYKYWNRKPEQTLEKDLTGVEKDLIKAKAIVRKEDDKMANKKSHVINTELYTELDRIQNDLEKVLDKINPKRPKKINKIGRAHV